MQAEFHSEIRRFPSRHLQARPSRRQMPAVCYQQLESRTLPSTAATTAFPIPESGNIGPLTLGSDGNLWYERITTRGGDANYPAAGRIGRVTPSGAVSEYPLPAGGYPKSDLTVGPDGNLWFTETVNDFSGNPPSSFVDRVTPSGVVSEYSLSAGVAPRSNVTVGPDGNLWFTEAVIDSYGFPTAGLIVRSTTSGMVSEFPIPRPGISSSNLTEDTDGNLWFIGSTLGKSSEFLGRVTPSGTISEYPLPAGGIIFTGDLTPGSDGNLWFIETVDKIDPNLGYVPSSLIGRVTSSGRISEYPLPSGGTARNLMLGPNGNLWFTGGKSGFINLASIGQVTPSGEISEYFLDTFRDPGGLTIGADGNLWFAQFATNESPGSCISRVTPSGTVTSYPLPPGETLSGDLTLGPDGELWFVGSVSTSDEPTPGIFVGRVAPTGVMSEIGVRDGIPISDGPKFLHPSTLTVGSDGNLWFTTSLTGFASLTTFLPDAGIAIDRINVASPSVTNITRNGVHAQPTTLNLSFSTPLDPASAVDLRNYVVVVSDARGRVHSRPLRFYHASYDAATRTVTLTMRHRLPIHGYYRVTVHGSLTGADGPKTNSTALLHEFGTVTPIPAHGRVAKAGKSSK